MDGTLVQEDPLSFWRDHVLHDMDQRLQPWIVESDERDDGSGNVLFYSLVSGYYYLIHIEEFKGRRVAGYGAGLLIGIDKDDDLSALLVNPLTGENTELPRLPEHFRGTFTYGFATDPDMTGENRVVVVLYNQPTQEARSKVALWRHGDAAGWATMPSEAFWMRMPQLRGRLVTHGPRVAEGEEAAAAGAAANGYCDMGDGWLPGMQGKYVIEHEGQVRVLVRMELPEIVGDVPPEGRPVRAGDPLPRLSFELRNTLAADGEAIDWADAPELHDKVIFQSQGSSCYVLPESDHFVGVRKNFIYFFSWQRQEAAVGDDGVIATASGGNPFGYFLCKWDMIGRVATVVRKLPGVWMWHKPPDGSCLLSSTRHRDSLSPAALGFEFQRSVCTHLYLMSCHVMRLIYVV